MPDLYDEDDFVIQKKSKGLHGEMIGHGEMLIELCCTSGIHMLNGCTTRYLNGELSCYAANSSRLMDYTLYLQLFLTRCLNLKLEMKINLLINLRYCIHHGYTNTNQYH